MTRKFLSAFLLLVMRTTLAAAQPTGYIISARDAEHLADEAGLRTRVAFFTDSLCTGRASGTPGRTSGGQTKYLQKTPKPVRM